MGASKSFTNDEWLSLAAEAPLDPSLPIIDAHHHAFESLPALRDAGSYAADRFAADIAASGHHIAATVYIETATAFRETGPASLASVGETEYANNIAKRYGSGVPALAAGIVGSADLRSPDLRAILAVHIDSAPGRFRGVRLNLAWDKDPEVRFRHSETHSGMARDPDIVNGLRALGNLGLSCDVLMFHPQLNELNELAARCPDTRFVLDHLGCPLGIAAYAQDREGVRRLWEEGMASLAARSNVSVKLGGMGMRVAGFGWPARARPPGSIELAEATREYHLYAIERFGPGRCMFESNFPPDGLSAPYGVIWNSFKRIASSLSSNEKHQLFYGTARETYQLEI
jgi:predicted TIM-barrel fold metal-dependent hydrolase